MPQNASAVVCENTEDPDSPGTCDKNFAEVHVYEALIEDGWTPQSVHVQNDLPIWKFLCGLTTRSRVSSRCASFIPTTCRV